MVASEPAALERKGEAWEAGTGSGRRAAVPARRGEGDRQALDHKPQSDKGTEKWVETGIPYPYPFFNRNIHILPFYEWV